MASISSNTGMSLSRLEATSWKVMDYPDVNSETCALEGQGHGMIVTSIKTSQGVVSLDGDHDDEYSLGDTDLFGGWTFILFFLIVGIGGGIGLFLVSTMVIRQGARATAEALLRQGGIR
ncbi:MAG: hypothetical protein CM15mP9_5500 [Methanobacteriota archaeon]|nr:MAG: hypothetical protein CM15mP9_5500 [Euryarchaeota archaeon]